MNSKISINVPPGVIERIRQVAVRRTNIPAPDQVDFKNSREMDIHREITGLMGEWTYAHYYGLEREEVFEDDKGGDGGFDFKVRDGPFGDVLKIDVKTRERKKADLLYPASMGIHADAYFLLERDNSTITIVGYCKGENLQKAEIYGRPFPTKTRMIPRSELSPPPNPDQIYPE